MASSLDGSGPGSPGFSWSKVLGILRKESDISTELAREDGEGVVYLFGDSDVPGVARLSRYSDGVEVNITQLPKSSREEVLNKISGKGYDIERVPNGSNRYRLSGDPRNEGLWLEAAESIEDYL